MPNWRILIVDDEDDIRSIVRAALSTRYEVVEARDGLEALQKLDLAEPDFVVLDVMMPMMDGYQTCEAIRRHPKYQTLSVLFLSALNSREDMMKGYTAGANLYLTKPFEPSRLLRNVDVFFESSNMTYTRKRYTLQQLQEMEQKGPDALAQARVTAAPTPPAGAQPVPPASSAHPPSAAPPQAPRVTPAPSPTGGKPRLLIVDDEESMRSIMKAMLSDRFEAFTADNGVQAIERITTYQPDLIILDAMMPKMSGYQLCQSLRRNARFSKTPILFVTAKSSARDKEYAIRIGADDVLGKPFEGAELVQRLLKLTEKPGFKQYPKTLSAAQIQELENRRKQALEEHQDRQTRKEDNDLERFLREHTR